MTQEIRDKILIYRGYNIIITTSLGLPKNNRIGINRGNQLRQDASEID